MKKSVIVLGANGKFGRAAIRAYHDAGWQVTGFARSKPTDEISNGVNWVFGNIENRDDLLRACDRNTVIVNAVHPPYEQWAAKLPVFTSNITYVARATNSTVMIPGNIYNYGEAMPDVLRETTPHLAQTKKGLLRIEMERAYKAASQTGMQTIILRCGDFIDVRESGNWFESHITKGLSKGKIAYPGRTDIEHAWAYLPDAARAMVQLSEKREELKSFEEFGFAGYTFSGSELAEMLSKTTKRTVKITNIPWVMVRMLGVFSKPMHEILEMRYLWNTPHRVDGTKLERLLPDFQGTPVDRVLEQQFGHLRNGAVVHGRRTAVGLS